MVAAKKIEYEADSFRSLIKMYHSVRGNTRSPISSVLEILNLVPVPYCRKVEVLTGWAINSGLPDAGGDEEEESGNEHMDIVPPEPAVNGVKRKLDEDYD